MIKDSKFTCTFIGLGLIGGSIAKAMRKNYPECKLYAYNRHPENIRAALEDNTLNAISEDLTKYISQSDIIFLCAPVVTNIANLKTIKPYLNKETLITDVGSVKGNIHEAVKELNLEGQFIGGHPMCGSEKTGYINAKENLLENSYYILTPTESVNPDWTESYYKLVKTLSGIPIVTDYKKHDYSTAAISHVPHLIAGELVRLVKDNDSDDEFMKMIAAGGFKDITRIASSSPEMWQSICESNTDNICDLMDKYIFNLTTINNALKNKDYDKVGQLFESVGPYRKSINDLSNSSIQKIFQLYVDIPDKYGAIAEVSTILAKNEINIKNIGISHNRENQDGCLYIEFDNEESMNKAKSFLLKSSYAANIF